MTKPKPGIQPANLRSPKAAFLDNMDHEIRTAINGIIGLLKLMEKEPLNNTARHYNHLAGASAESLLSLINDMLDFAKIEDDRLELENVSFDLQTLLMEIYELYLARVQGKAIDLTLNIKGISQSCVRGDPHRLQQVFDNLLNNAIKFTDAGKISIRAATELMDDQLLLFKASVTDTGTGITPEKANRLFESVTPGDNPTPRKYGGSGLGLILARQLCELMGGRVSFTSQLNQGSRFDFEVLLATSSDSDMETDIQLSPICHSHELNLTRLLLVEDDPINTEVALGILQDFDINTEVATNGREAINKLTELAPDNYFDLILMDCHMPHMDGFTATRKIREGVAGGRFQAVPIIAMTTTATDDDRDRCLAAGMNDCLNKPIDVTLLEQKLAYWSHSGEWQSPPDSITGPSQVHDQVWDREAALKRLHWREDRLSALTDTYLQAAPEQFKKLKRAIENNAFERASTLSHTIKGAAGNLGLMKFYRDLQQAESLAHEHQSDALRSFLPDLEAAFKQTLKALKTQTL